MQNKLTIPFAVAALVTSSASAQVVTTWDASAGRLPEDDLPAWTLSLDGGACSGATATLGGGLLVLDNASACPTDIAAYGVAFHGPPFQPVPATYFIDASVRVVSGAQASIERGVTALALAPPILCPWVLELDLGEVRLHWALQQMLGSAAVDTTTALRTYRLEVDTATYASRVYVDGALVLSAPAPIFGCNTPGVWQPSAHFGNVAAAEGGVSEWARVTHNLADGAVFLCTSAQLNSSGWIASMTYSGDRTLASNDVVLRASGVPPGSFGYFLCSRALQAPSALPGSQGLLCLGPPVGRFNRPGEVRQAGNDASVELPIDLTDLPQPTGSVMALPGESWHFQLWYRDANPTPTSNTSLGLRLTFM